MPTSDLYGSILVYLVGPAPAPNKSNGELMSSFNLIEGLPPPTIAPPGATFMFQQVSVISESHCSFV